MAEREAIQKIGDEILQRMFAHPPEDAGRYLCRVTSGTSGRAPLVLVTEFPPEAPADAAAKAADARMLTFNGSVASRLANVFVVSRTQGGTARVLSLDKEDVVPGLERLLEDYAPNLMHGFPSFIARGLPYVSARVASGVTRVTLSGEALTAAFEQVLRERLPNAKQVELYMALEAGGYIGTRLCGFLPRGSFHPARGVTIEIENVDEEGIGDILVSKTLFPGVSIKQYRIGDMGRFVEGDCPCGEHITFEFTGRRGVDHIKLGGAILTREEFDRAVSRFPGIIDDYRVEITPTPEGGRSEVRMIAFRRAGAGTSGLAHELAEQISRMIFVTQTKTYHDLVADGALTPLSFEFSSSPLPESHKDIKLRVRSRDAGA